MPPRALTRARTQASPGPRSMLNDIYNKRIIELAGNIPRLGRLPDPDASATAHSKLCGSTVKIDLKMDGPVVTDFAHDVKACALGQASSSIMASHVVGSTASELRELGARLQGAPRLDHADLRRRGRRHRPDRSQGQTAGIGVGVTRRPTHRRHAREGGHPVRREFSITHRRHGVPDHPPSRMITVLAEMLLISADRARSPHRRSAPALRPSWSISELAAEHRLRPRN